MRLTIVAFLALLMASPVAAQRHKLTINAETPEGQLLQQIGLEEDPAKKLGLMEQFTIQHPKHEAAAWVYNQMQERYLKGNEFDKAMDAGAKLLEIDPEDVRVAHACLKAAEGKKDAALIKKWAIETSEIARRVAKSAKPEDEEEAEQWKSDVDFATQVETYSEYSLHAAALQAADPKQRIDLAETLKQRNPNSQYLPQLDTALFLAYRQLNDTAQAVAVAERVLAKDQSNEDMLLVAADYYFNQKKETDKMLGYLGKLTGLMKSKPKPDGMSDEEWGRKKNLTLGVAYWMTGVTYSTQGKYSQADKELRDGLEYMKDNEQMLAGALFHLGLANYKLGDRAKNPDTQRILDALRFNERCAAIKSPFQSQARRNIAAIQSQYRIR